MERTKEKRGTLQLVSAAKDTELLAFNHRCFSGRFLMCVSHCGNVLVRESITEKHAEV